jgi:hypothetical protein
LYEYIPAMIAPIFQEEFSKMGFAAEVGNNRLAIVPLGLAIQFDVPPIHAALPEAAERAVIP